MKAWSHKKLHVNPKFVGLCLDLAKQNLSGQKRYTVGELKDLTRHRAYGVKLP